MYALLIKPGANIHGGFMAEVLLKGNPIHTFSDLPAIGVRAPDFKLVRQDLSIINRFDYEGRKCILNIVPSIDTGVCANSVREFDKRAGDLKHTGIITISRDVPFAQKVFNEKEGIVNVLMLSEMNSCAFGFDYGVLIIDGPLRGLFARAVLVLDENGNIIYKQLVRDISHEPDYDKTVIAAGE